MHVQLKTESKLFCSCSTLFGAPPNSQTCPVCLGLPGSLPTLNKKALEYAIRAAVALNCKVNKLSFFSRKNYFYPDLPKNYQISQYDSPLAVDGLFCIRVNERLKEVRIRRLHLEEDAGKLLHTEDASLIDYNRCGIPLIEIVTAPCMHFAEEAYKFLTYLKNTLRYIGVSDCDMEKGSLRCDVNVSVQREGEEQEKTEIKNLNSFKAVKDALSYEIKRQVQILKRGKDLEHQTRLWDEGKGSTYPMRTKEEAHDYRYFPEPDLLPLKVDEAWIKQIEESLPELPLKREERFVKEYKIPLYDAEVLVQEREIADFFEQTLQFYPNCKKVSNWIMEKVLEQLNLKNISLKESNLSAENFAQLLRLLEEGRISARMAKELFPRVFNGENPEEIVKKEGISCLEDREKLLSLLKEALEENPKAVQEYKSGKEKVAGYFVGQVMRKSGGRAEPKTVLKLLKELLNEG